MDKDKVFDLAAHVLGDYVFLTMDERTEAVRILTNRLLNTIDNELTYSGYHREAKQ